MTDKLFIAPYSAVTTIYGGPLAGQTVDSADDYKKKKEEKENSSGTSTTVTTIYGGPSAGQTVTSTVQEGTGNHVVVEEKPVEQQRAWWDTGLNIQQFQASPSSNKQETPQQQKEQSVAQGVTASNYATQPVEQQDSERVTDRPTYKEATRTIAHLGQGRLAEQVKLQQHRAQYDEAVAEHEAKENKRVVVESLDKDKRTTAGTKYRVHQVTIGMQRRIANNDNLEIIEVRAGNSDVTECAGGSASYIGRDKLDGIPNSCKAVVLDRSTGMLYAYADNDYALSAKRELTGLDDTELALQQKYNSDIMAIREKSGAVQDKLRQHYLTGGTVYGGENAGKVSYKYKDKDGDNFAGVHDLFEELDKYQEEEDALTRAYMKDCSDLVRTRMGAEQKAGQFTFTTDLAAMDANENVYNALHAAFALEPGAVDTRVKTLILGGKTQEDVSAKQRRAHEAFYKALQDFRDEFGYTDATIDELRQVYARSEILHNSYMRLDDNTVVYDDGSIVDSLNTYGAKIHNADLSYRQGLESAMTAAKRAAVVMDDTDQTNTIVDIFRKEYARQAFGKYAESTMGQDSLELLGNITGYNVFKSCRESGEWDGFGKQIAKNLGTSFLAGLAEVGDIANVINGFISANTLFSDDTTPGYKLTTSGLRWYGASAIRYDEMSDDARRYWIDMPISNTGKLYGAWACGDIQHIPTIAMLTYYGEAWETIDKYDGTWKTTVSDTGYTLYSIDEFDDKALNATYKTLMFGTDFMFQATLSLDNIVSAGAGLASTRAATQLDTGADVAKSIVKSTLDDVGRYTDDIGEATVKAFKNEMVNGVRSGAFKSYDDYYNAVQKVIGNVVTKDADDLTRAFGVAASEFKPQYIARMNIAATQYLDDFARNEGKLRAIWEGAQAAVSSVQTLEAVEHALQGVSMYLARGTVRGVFAMVKGAGNVLKAVPNAISAFNETATGAWVQLQARKVGVMLTRNAWVAEQFRYGKTSIDEAVTLMRGIEASSIVDTIQAATKHGMDPTPDLLGMKNLNKEMIDRLTSSAASTELKVYKELPSMLSSGMRDTFEADGVLYKAEEWLDYKARTLGYDSFAAHMDAMSQTATTLSELGSTAYAETFTVLKNQIISDEVYRTAFRQMGTFSTQANAVRAMNIALYENRGVSDAWEALSNVISTAEIKYSADDSVFDSLRAAKLLSSTNNTLAVIGDMDTLSVGLSPEDMRAAANAFAEYIRGEADSFTTAQYYYTGRVMDSEALKMALSERDTFMAHSASDVISAYLEDLGYQPTNEDIARICRSSVEDFKCDGVQAAEKIYGVMLSKGNNMYNICTPKMYSLVDELYSPDTPVGRAFSQMQGALDGAMYGTVLTSDGVISDEASKTASLISKNVDRIVERAEAMRGSAYLVSALEETTLSPSATILVRDAYAGHANTVNSLYTAFRRGDQSAIQRTVDTIVDASQKHGNALGNKSVSFAKYGYNTVDLKANVQAMIDSGAVKESDEFIDVYVSAHSVTKNDPFAISFGTRDGGIRAFHDADSVWTSFNDTAVVNGTRYTKRELQYAIKSYEQLSNRDYYGSIDKYLRDIQAANPDKQIRFIGCNADAVGSNNMNFLKGMVYRNGLKGLSTNNYLDLTTYAPEHLNIIMDGAADLVRFSDNDVSEIRRVITDLFTHSKYINDAESIAFDIDCDMHLGKLFPDSGTGNEIIDKWIDEWDRELTRNVSNMLGQGDLFIDDPLITSYIDSTELNKLVSTILDKPDYHVNIQNILEEYAQANTYNLTIQIDTALSQEWFDFTRELTKDMPLQAVTDVARTLQDRAAKISDTALERTNTKQLKRSIANILALVETPDTDFSMEWTRMRPEAEALHYAVQSGDKRKMLAALDVYRESFNINFYRVYPAIDNNNSLIQMMFTEEGRAQYLYNIATNIRYDRSMADLLTINQGHLVREVSAVQEALDSITQNQTMNKDTYNLLRAKMAIVQASSDNTIGQIVLENQLRLLDEFNERSDELYKTLLGDTALDLTSNGTRGGVKTYVGVRNAQADYIARYNDIVRAQAANTVLSLDTDSFDALLLGRMRNTLVVQPDSEIFTGMKSFSNLPVYGGDTNAVGEWLASLDSTRYNVEWRTINNKQCAIVSLKLDNFSDDELSRLYERTRTIDYSALTEDIITRDTIDELDEGIRNRREAYDNLFDAKKNITEALGKARSADRKLKLQNQLTLINADLATYASLLDMSDEASSVVDALNKFDRGVADMFGNSSYRLSTRRIPVSDEWTAFCDSASASPITNTLFDTPYAKQSDNFICNMLCDDDIYKEFDIHGGASLTNNINQAFNTHLSNLARESEVLGLIAGNNRDVGTLLTHATRQGQSLDDALRAIETSKLKPVRLDYVEDARGLKTLKVEPVQIETLDTQVKGVTLVTSEELYTLNNMAKGFANERAAYSTPYRIAAMMQQARRLRSAYVTGNLYLANIGGTAFRNVVDSNTKALADVGLDQSYFSNYAHAVGNWDTWDRCMADVYNKTGRFDPSAIDEYFDMFDNGSLPYDPLISREQATLWWGIYNADGFSDFSDIKRIIGEIDNKQLLDSLSEQGVNIAERDRDVVKRVFQAALDKEKRTSLRGFTNKADAKTITDVTHTLQKELGWNEDTARAVAGTYTKWSGEGRLWFEKAVSDDTAIGRVLGRANKVGFDNAEKRARTAIMQTWLERGLSIEEANEHVIKTQFNYALKSDMLKGIDTVFPFSTYQYYNAKFWCDPSNYSGTTMWFMRNYTLATSMDSVTTKESLANELKATYLRTKMSEMDKGPEDAIARQGMEDTEVDPFIQMMLAELEKDVTEYKGTQEFNGWISGIDLNGSHYLKVGNGMFDTISLMAELATIPHELATGNLPDIIQEKLVPPFNTVVSLLQSDFTKDIKSFNEFLDKAKVYGAENYEQLLHLIPIVGNVASIALGVAKHTIAEGAAYDLGQLKSIMLLGGQQGNSEVIHSVFNLMADVGLGLGNGIVGKFRENNAYEDREPFYQHVDENGNLVTWYDLSAEEKKKYRYVIGGSYIPQSTFKPSDQNTMYYKLLQSGLDKQMAKYVINRCKNIGAWSYNSVYYYKNEKDGKYYARKEMLESTIIEMLDRGFNLGEIFDLLDTNDKWWDSATGKIMDSNSLYNEVLSSEFLRIYNMLPEYITHSSSDQYKQLQQYYMAMGMSKEEALMFMIQEHGYISEDGNFYMLTDDEVDKYNAYEHGLLVTDKDSDFLQRFEQLPDAIRFTKGAYKRTKDYLLKHFEFDVAWDMMMNGAYLTEDGRLIKKLVKENNFDNAKKAFQDENGYWHKAGDFQVDGYWFHEGDIPYLGLGSFEAYWNTLPNYLRYTKGAWSQTNKVLKDAGFDYNTRMRAMQQGAFAMQVDPNSEAFKQYLDALGVEAVTETVYVEKTVPLSECKLVNGEFQWVDPDTLDTVEKRMEFYASNGISDKRGASYDSATVTVKVPTTVTKLKQKNSDNVIGTVCESGGQTYVIVDSSGWETPRKTYGGRGRRYYEKAYKEYSKKTYLPRGRMPWAKRFYPRRTYNRVRRVYSRGPKLNQPFIITHSNVRTYSKVNFLQGQSAGYRYWYRWNDANYTNHRPRSKAPSTYRNPLARSRNLYKDMYAKYGASRMQMRQNIKGYSNAAITRLRRNEIKNRLTDASIRLGRTSGTAKHNKNRHV